MNRFRMVVVWLLICSGSSMLVGCNTIEGAGEDIEQGGEAIQEAVD
jgi:predicted small secreted protein